MQTKTPSLLGFTHFALKFQVARCAPAVDHALRRRLLAAHLRCVRVDVIGLNDVDGGAVGAPPAGLGCGGRGDDEGWIAATMVFKGTGIAHVADGKIWGRDSIMTYSGTCKVDGDRFSAILSIKRHTEGHATVFGADDLMLMLEGTCTGKIARCVGTAEQVSGVLLEETLILAEEEPPPPRRSAPPPTFKPARFPKLPKRSR